jgi:hypothetical protein
MRLVDPFDLKPEDICIKDIAHHLARICRWNGGVNGFYSVAEHSIAVAKSVAPKFQLWGLLHDAAETYIGDITRPVKSRLWVCEFNPYIAGSERLRDLENQILEVVAKRFNLIPEMPEQVKRADDEQLAREDAQIRKGKLEGNYPNIAEVRFLAVFNKLMEERD